METKFKIKELNFRDERQKDILKFILKVLKTFNEDDYKAREIECRKFIDKSCNDTYVKINDLLQFKSAVEHWLRNKFLKFSEQEIKYLVSRTKDYRNKETTDNKVKANNIKNWMMFCLTVEPKPVEPKEKRLVFKEKKKEKGEVVEFDFDE